MLFFHKLIIHGSLSNESDEVRWSFDLRYYPIGHSTGRGPSLDSLPAAVLIPRACCAIPPRRRPGSRSIQPLEPLPRIRPIRRSMRLTVAYELTVPGVRTSPECVDTDSQYNYIFQWLLSVREKIRHAKKHTGHA